MISSIWLILLTVVVLVLVLGGSGGAHTLRKLLIFILAAGAVLALLALVVYPFRQSHHNVYLPPHIEVAYDDAFVNIDGGTMQAVAPGGAAATVHVAGPLAPSGELATWAKILIIGAPALVALAALAAIRRPHAGKVKHGSGVIWLTVGVAMLVLLGFVFIGRVDVQAPTSAAINTYPPLSAAAPSNRSLIDEQWDRLTGPRIALEEAAAVQAQSQIKAQAGATQDLHEAAEVLQAASQKMGQAASQGWLYAAAQTFLDTQSNQPAARSVSQGPIEPLQPVATSSESTTPEDSADHSQPIGEISRTPRSAKPDWVLRPPGIVGNVRKVVVSVGPYKTLEECHFELEHKMRDVVAARIAELASAATGASVNPPALEFINLGTDYILRELCTEEFVEEVDSGVGPMKTAYALMEFTEPQNTLLVTRWKDHARRHRLAAALFGASLVVGGLALGYGLLKVDTWTRGYYSKRLFIGVPAAIIGAVALLAMMS